MLHIDYSHKNAEIIVQEKTIFINNNLNIKLNFFLLFLSLYRIQNY